MSDARLQNVSDTALWVAEYRAIETRREDAIFRDPYAEKLAGDRGKELVRSMGVASFAWPMIVRTAVMDEIILRSIEKDGVDCVVNLAAGLDARPYRLPLPKALRWIEVDLAPMIAFKEEKLRGEVPVCRLERVGADLADAAARRAVVEKVASQSQRVLVVTEGLLIYLPEAQVAELARDLSSSPAFHLWLTDLASPRLLKMLTRRLGKHLDAANAPFLFAPASGTKFFEAHGFREREFRSTFEEGWRLKRVMRGAWLFRFLGRLYPAKKREEMLRMGGIVLLGRAAARV